MSNIIVEFEAVEKNFKNQHALRGVSFQIKEGEILGFIGPNGCGKTTTARLILGFYQPTKGTVRVFGCDPASEFHRTGGQIGVMLEQPGLYDSLTACEYLEYLGALLRIPSVKYEKQASELLRMVGLSDRANNRLRTFSKGMRQRISMARCLLNHPRLIIMDEPFDGLDIESRRLILDLLPRLAREQGTTVFVTSHNLSEVEEISDRVAIIKQGSLLAVDKMELLKKRVPNHKLLVVSLAQDYPEEMLGLLLPEAEYCRKSRSLKFNLDSGYGNHNDLLLQIINSGILIDSVEKKSTSLEDVYFTLTKTV